MPVNIQAWGHISREKATAPVPLSVASMLGGLRNITEKRQRRAYKV